MEIMNVSDQVIAVLDALCAKFGLVVDWTASNVTPYINALMHKVVLYEMVTSITWIVFTFAIFIFAITLFNKMERERIPKAITDQFDAEDVQLLILGFFVLSGIAFVFTCVVQAFDIVACAVFQEKVILTYVQKLLAQPK